MLILAGVSFIAALTLSVYPHSIFQSQVPYGTRQSQTAKKTVARVKGIAYVVPSLTPANTPTPTIIYKTVKQITSTSQPTSAPSTTQQTTMQSALPQNQTTAQTNPQPTSVSKQTTSNVVATVNLQINEPDGTSNFSVTLNSGNNLCDNLTEAKNEGKIKSLTLDNSYVSTMHSTYVREINGYQNNWVVSINGKKPQGCSLYTPNPGDNIVWKFG